MIKPYGYQVPIIRDVVSALKRDGRTLMVMATGTGKTITSALVVQELVRRRGRVLFLCHNNDILRQSIDSYHDVFNGTRVMGEFTGDKKESAQFLFGSFQTMHGHRETFDPDFFDMIVVDEGHHAQADTYRTTLEYFKPKYLLAMTATPDREDGRDIRDIFGQPSAELKLEEAIARHYLSPVTYKLMTVGTASREALKRLAKRVKGGDRITLRDLNDNVFVENLDEDVAEEIMRHKGQGIIFCTSIQQAELMATRLKKAKPYHSEMSRVDCRRELKAFREKRLRYLLTVDKFNEGIDIPHAEVVVFLRSTESLTIFLQQLGRGLRKMKDKERVTALDFVGNADRIKMVSDFVGTVRDIEGPDDEDDSVFDTSGIDFNLDAESRDVLDILGRINVQFYPTMAEAMRAVQRLGIKSVAEYKQRYKGDPRLPSAPDDIYTSEWVSWTYFLGKEGFCSFLEAVKVVQRLGIKSCQEYKRRYREGSRLPSNPDVVYASEWKGWLHFLSGIDPIPFYSFLEAMEVVRRMGIQSVTEYSRRYKEDPRLPSAPDKTYASEWKGWAYFFGKEGFYSFLQAMEVVRRMGIKGSIEYSRRYKEDPRLPSAPDKTYASEWKGWAYFFGKEGFYSFLQAMEVVRRMGINTGEEYRLRYKEDPRLPANPDRTYASEWKGWAYFLGKEGFYSFLQAMEVVRRMGIKGSIEYSRRYKEDPRLPSSPDRTYVSEWKGWLHFLGKASLRRIDQRGFYSFLEAMEVVKRMGIKTREGYKRSYKEDPRLPSAPEQFYVSEWVSWSYFLTGVERFPFYSFLEAMEVVERVSIKSKEEYQRRYKEDPRLPSNPSRTYASEWVSWPHFLGKLKPQKF